MVSGAHVDRKPGETNGDLQVGWNGGGGVGGLCGLVRPCAPSGAASCVLVPLN